jgi:hypothetical protein
MTQILAAIGGITLGILIVLFMFYLWGEISDWLKVYRKNHDLKSQIKIKSKEINKLKQTLQDINDTKVDKKSLLLALKSIQAVLREPTDLPPYGITYPL